MFKLQLKPLLIIVFIIIILSLIINKYCIKENFTDGLQLEKKLFNYIEEQLGDLGQTKQKKPDKYVNNINLL